MHYQDWMRYTQGRSKQNLSSRPRKKQAPLLREAVKILAFLQVFAVKGALFIDKNKF